MSDHRIETIIFSMDDPNYETFKKKVDELNDKYSYWLEKYDDVITGKAPVDLNNYYSIYTSNGRHTFNVLHMENFPKEIQKDLKQAFIDSYN
ncbi:hypothetical protein SRABI27_00313 [Pedobacter sp. Bi27]|uniref:hypothetical protein n=1 Tax=Pedobacter sp. Bi27 TaxID=2822351 RepID=UPI001DE302FD|nr:hypothetical protein [Pedobacter sp. Bi27]CAH0142428.1 hypothetical protein SRABI27_00313 [Pedobacter sp. Bi27]